MNNEKNYTHDDLMDLAGWMAACDNSRPVHELKEEAEQYIRTKLDKKPTHNNEKEKLWQGQIPEEHHIALHYCKAVSNCDETAARIKEYGDRRVREFAKYPGRNDALLKIAQRFCGMTPRDKGCATWAEMHIKLVAEVVDAIFLERLEHLKTTHPANEKMV